MDIETKLCFFFFKSRALNHCELLIGVSQLPTAYNIAFSGLLLSRKALYYSLRLQTRDCSLNPAYKYQYNRSWISNMMFTPYSGCYDLLPNELIRCQCPVELDHSCCIKPDKSELVSIRLTNISASMSA